MKTASSLYIPEIYFLFPSRQVPLALRVQCSLTLSPKESSRHRLCNLHQYQVLCVHHGSDPALCVQHSQICPHTKVVLFIIVFKITDSPVLLLNSGLRHVFCFHLLFQVFFRWVVSLFILAGKIHSGEMGLWFYEKLSLMCGCVGVWKLQLF